ncbi:Glycine receptor subunit beta-like 4 [Homarus americanus]|uniref:Glycine receptor subunit beta-like 4 n=1 Tax=Homarus americanus TaxID=6706 RepID=A0A8J5N0G7_HOMAM|nr:Glycine receptor subunit beta-like 4 [Homarus americanus]
MAGCPRLVRCLPGATTTLTLALLALLLPPAAHGETKGFTIDDIMPLDKSNYDKMRPPKKEGKATVVFFHVTVMGIDSINENSMTYAADIFFAQTWKDHRLRLPENMTTEYRLLDLDWLKHLWRPDSFFKNAKQVTFQTMTIPNHYVWLFQDSKILYMVKLTLKLSCAMNFAIYPHDTQECKLQMESLSHTTEELVFEWDTDVPLAVDESIELPQQDIIMNYTSDCTQVYSTVGILLDQARNRASTSDAGSDITTDTLHSTSEIAGLLTACVLHQDHRYFHVLLHSESRRFLLGEPPKPAGPSPAQIRRGRALMVDRVSRYLFPLSFALLNAVYWFSFRQYL